MNPHARSRLSLAAALWVVHVTRTNGIVGAAGGAGRVDASCLLQLAVEESRGTEGNEGANRTGTREVRRGNNKTEQQLAGANQTGKGHAEMKRADAEKKRGDVKRMENATGTRQRKVDISMVKDHANRDRAKSDPGHWELIFRQSSGSFRSPVSSWLLVNENATDTSSGDYSVLQNLEGLRRLDGDFLLKLAWPGASLQDQVWRQTSNPITRLTGGVDGYQAVSVPYTDQFWGGLEYNGGPALLDGSVDHNNFFYAVGTKSAWSGGIPGPPLGWPVPSTELYAWVGADYGVAASDQSSIVGDPHVVNMAREHFAIRAEGRHKLLQIPRSLGEKQEPSLRVDAAVEHLDASSCNSTFVKSLAFLGNWTGPFGQLRVTPGSDAPNTTLQANGQEPDAFFGRFPAHDVQVGDTFLGLKFGKVGFHVAKHYEGRYGGQRGFLNLRVTGLKRYSDVGGLLGYDGHADAEKPSPSCVQPRPPQADATAASLVGRGRSPTPGGGGSVISVD